MPAAAPVDAAAMSVCTKNVCVHCVCMPLVCLLVLCQYGAVLFRFLYYTPGCIGTIAVGLCAGLLDKNKLVSAVLLLAGLASLCTFFVNGGALYVAGFSSTRACMQLFVLEWAEARRGDLNGVSRIHPDVAFAAFCFSFSCPPQSSSVLCVLVLGLLFTEIICFQCI